MVLPHTSPGFSAARLAPSARQPMDDVAPAPLAARDVIWDRPLFRPPDLSNWRVIFDPMPFRHQDFSRRPR